MATTSQAPVVVRNSVDTSPPSDLGASLSAARMALNGPATISVIGDSTGNDLDEWVNLWAVDLGRDHAVTLQRWLHDSYRSDPPEYGRHGDKITIWNASEPGGRAGWATTKLDKVQPERPDLIILSLGHNNTDADIAPQLEQLRVQLDKGTPVVFILQNPGRGDQEVRQAKVLAAATAWARNHGVPTIDVTAAFTHPQNQMLDDIHPNKAGSRAWADAVGQALAT